MDTPLTQRACTSIVWKRRRYVCDFSFNAVLDVIRVLSDGAINDSDKMNFCIWRMVRTTVLRLHRQELLTCILNTLLENSKKEGPRSIDFEQDAGPIRAGFLQAYGIDLEKEREKLPWKTFLSLLGSLPSSTRMAEIVETRLRPLPPPNKYNAQEINALLKAKAAVALKPLTAEQGDVWGSMFDSLLAMTKR